MREGERVEGRKEGKKERREGGIVIVNEVEKYRGRKKM